MYLGKEFIETKFTSLDGKTIYSIKENSSEVLPFEIRCDSQGMTFKGVLSKTLDTEEDLSEFARLIADSWNQRRNLKVKIALTPTGH